MAWDSINIFKLYNNYTSCCSFMQVGIQHYDLIFPDGTTPPKHVLLKFLYIAETTSGAVGVHCKVIYNIDCISIAKKPKLLFYV